MKINQQDIHVAIGRGTLVMLVYLIQEQNL